MDSSDSGNPKTSSPANEDPELNAARALGESASLAWGTGQNLGSDLCPDCLAFRDAVANDRSHSIETTLEQLQKSSCEFCDVLCRIIHWSGIVRDPGHSLRVSACKTLFSIFVGLHGLDGRFPLVELYRELGVPCPWGIVSQERRDVLSPGSPDSVRQIFQWINRCRQTHALCNVRDAAFMPTRLIDLGPGNHAIRLVETDSETKGLYVCLSHCWGDKTPLTTRLNNLQMHLDSINWQEIPQTFRDAICYARLLRIRYIWIDSLCIIQDDPDDWSTESKVMGQIFSNAYLTLGAVTAPDSSVGMFSKPASGRLYSEGKFSGITTAGLPYLYNVLKSSHLYGFHPVGSVIEEDPKKFPLLGRAWAFQERIMSPRFLHIGYPELRWECKEANMCECGKIDEDSAKATWASVLGSSSLSPWQMEKARRDLVEGYSALNHTREEDKLPAFSGLAKQACRDSPPSEYLAGLFRSSLISDMLWMKPKWCEHSHGRKPNRWRAPTWSWASLDAPVEFPLGGPHPVPDKDSDGSGLVKAYMEIVEASCTPSTVDPMGQVSEGFITLRGPVVDCSIRDRKWSHRELFHRDMCICGELYFDHFKDAVPGQVRIIRAAMFRQANPKKSYLEGEYTEYSLVVECVDASANKYRRLGVLRQRPKPGSIGEECPSACTCCQIETVTII